MVVDSINPPQVKENGIELDTMAVIVHRRIGADLCPVLCFAKAEQAGKRQRRKAEGARPHQYRA